MMEDDEYRRADGISKSDLNKWITGEGPKGRHLLIGSVLDSWITRSKEYMAQHYCTAPEDYDLRTTAGKINLQEFEESQGGKKALRPKERALVVRLYNALMANSDARAIIEAQGRNQLACFAKLEGFNSLSKCLIDFERRMPLIDLKTTGYADEQEFKQAIVDYGYTAQAAYYTDIYAALTGEYRSFYFLCVSKRDDHKVWLTQATPGQMAHGRRWYQDVLTLYERYGENNVPA